jgi:hypothetical protein
MVGARQNDPASKFWPVLPCPYLLFLNENQRGPAKNEGRAALAH